MSARSTALLALLALSLLGRAALAEDPRDKPGQDPSECAKVKGEARYKAYGYHHIVSVTNGCDKTVKCQVWTDVDPKKHLLVAEPGEQQSIVTRIGSPARAFKALSECSF